MLFLDDLSNVSDFVRYNDPNPVDALTMDPVLAPGNPKSLKFAPLATGYTPRPSPLPPATYQREFMTRS